MSRRCTCCRWAREAGALRLPEQVLHLLQQYAQSLPPLYLLFRKWEQKTLTLAGARDKQSSRYHPDLLMPRGISLDECYKNRISNTPVYNGTNRLDLLP